MNKINHLLIVGLLCFFILTLIFCGNNEAKKNTDLSWPEVIKINKPWTYWWWMGSAVDKKNLTQTLEEYQKAGMGGVHIIPIYGVKGYEQRYINYLSPKWMEMLGHTIKEAQRLNMGVDMTTGTGWPFGGPQVSAEDAAAKVILKTYTLDANARLSDRLQEGALQCLVAYSNDGKRIDLTEKVNENGILDWIAPKGKWELYAVSQTGTGQQVKRAAPAGEGNVLNPFSDTALKNYLVRFDSAFAAYQGEIVRAFYNDSYEVYDANWTNDFFKEFKSRRGYDLRQQLSAFFGKGSPDIVARIKCDYRETIAELLHEEYTIPWVKWCQQKGSITRNQAHGSPGNLLDLYSTADIPETEIFGPSGFKIKGLRIDPDFPEHQSKPDPLMIKFASSAAHVTGKNLISSESCTWLGEHFKVALSQAKPEIDQLFISGINHVFYHGMTYSPFNEPWPGWLFYASTNFGPSNSFWRDINQLNGYITRCQSILQSGTPANDILLYYPIYDWWNKKDGMLDRFDVHSINKWLYGSNFHKSAKHLWDRGYTYDYISDRLLEKVKFSENRLQTGGINYRVFVVPECHFMPLGTLEKLINLARAGATIIVQNRLPLDVPGFGELKNRQQLFNETLAVLKLSETEHQGINQANIGNGRFWVGENLEKMLTLADISREPIVDTGVQFIRRSFKDGFHYFLTNLSSKKLNGWVTLGLAAKSVMILDPITARGGLAALRQTENGKTQIYLQLRSGESRILRVFSSRDIKGQAWRYLEAGGKSTEIKGVWKVSFLEGGPELPAGFETRKLASWTGIGDDKAKSFSGTAHYTITFDKPSTNVDDWVLDLGHVCESARVKINDRHVGVLWSLPFRIPVEEFLVHGKNVLEVEVTNLSANRIADLDRRKVNWKKFHNINFVNIKYEKFDASHWEPLDSGLLGPVQLIPAVVMKFPDLSSRSK